MPARGIHRTSAVALSILAPLGLMLALAACTVSGVGPPATATATASPPTATATATRATLTCAYTFVSLPILQDRPTTAPFAGDEVELLCLVTGAPTTDTSFTLTFMVTGQSPPSPPAASPCIGVLQRGKGACAHTYIVGIGPPPLTPIAPNSQPFTAVVSGVLNPSGQRVGPVTPIPASE